LSHDALGDRPGVTSLTMLSCSITERRLPVNLTAISGPLPDLSEALRRLNVDRRLGES